MEALVPHIFRLAAFRAMVLELLTYLIKIHR
jgi:hypothetical protein